jgi:chemotaxis protein histidine kinase CheA
MRARTTWQNEGTAAPRQAATQRRADIYKMNQEHPNPGPTDYESGDPDSWAETPVPGDKMSVNAEYEGEHVKRNELGFGEFRDDTWKHKDSDKWNSGGKYDNSKVAAERKASAVEHIARAIIRSGDEHLIEQTSCDLMALPDQAIIATVKRMNETSVDALPADAKHRRALACTKLAIRLLGSAANDQTVETVARDFMKVDDPTLKAILRNVASAIRTAQEQQQEQEEEEEEGGSTAQEEEEEEEEEEEGAAAKKTGQQEQQGQQQQQSQQEQQGQQQQQSQQEQQQGQQEQQGQQQQQSQQEQLMAQQQQLQAQQQQLQAQQEQQQQQQAPCAQQQQDACGLSPAEMAALDGVLQSEAAPGDGLSALFTPPAPAAPVPGAVPAAPIASGSPEITFGGDDEDEELGVTTASASLDDLFADDPEVQAQRQIMAAQREQLQREVGYQGVGRTASAKGAKKIGQVVRQTPAKPEEALEALWERP